MMAVGSAAMGTLVVGRAGLVATQAAVEAAVEEREDPVAARSALAAVRSAAAWWEVGIEAARLAMATVAVVEGVTAAA